MLNSTYAPELSVSIGKRQLSSTGKLQAPEAKSQIRLRLKRTSESLLRGEPPTRWPTRRFQTEICRSSIALSHFRNAIPLISIRAYTFLYDETTASYSYDEMLTSPL